MCLAIPAKITQIENHHALVDTMGFMHRVNIQLVEGVSQGDYILVHAGFAIQKIDMNEYDELKRLISALE